MEQDLINAVIGQTYTNGQYGEVSILGHIDGRQFVVEKSKGKRFATVEISDHEAAQIVKRRVFKVGDRVRDTHKGRDGTVTGFNEDGQTIVTYDAVDVIMLNGSSFVFLNADEAAA